MIERRRRLAEAAALVPRILADAHAAGTLPAAVRRSLVADARLTSTGMGIVMLTADGGRPSSVVKLPVTAAAARGLAREGAAMTALHADARLDGWRALLARPLASGSVLGQAYRVDSALSGRSVDAGEAGRRGLQDGAAETIHLLHQATATRVAGDVERWIDAPVRDLARHGPPPPFIATRMRRLREELHEAVAGRDFSAGWIHGDYWIGNLLFEEARERPAGIVDWEAAAAPELAVHDVLHLLVSTRREASGEQMGTIVREQLRHWSWPLRERRLLERYATWRHDGSLSDRHALLLYWLRQVAMEARQRSRIGGLRYRLWEARNVHVVLAAL
ncbi:phosphotransferase family protein [Candidatus Solirubrobacter pratensis]|uniref:phosphotransferase family protein n=1 Tax=Candidatus Solirubrobacter pratensis TaxID=1298857 RepID=UPI000427D283|nr:phosphotransferase [Candidatus Solirubrobacter pratensis]